MSEDQRIKEAAAKYRLEPDAEVTMSSKRQITLPAAMVRKLGLKPGAKLSVYLDDGEIVLQARPSGIMAFAGILRDNPIYGRTKEEIAEYIRWVREGGDEPGAADRD